MPKSDNKAHKHSLLCPALLKFHLKPLAAPNNCRLERVDESLLSCIHGSNRQYYIMCWCARQTEPAFSIFSCYFLSNKLLDLLRKISVYILGVERVHVPARGVPDVAVLPYQCI